MKKNSLTNEIAHWLESQGWKERPEMKPDGTSVTSFRFAANGMYGLQCLILAEEEIKMITVIAKPDFTVSVDVIEELRKFCSHFHREHGNIYITDVGEINYIHSRSIDSFSMGLNDVGKELKLMIDEMDQYITFLAPDIVSIANKVKKSDEAIGDLNSEYKFHKNIKNPIKNTIFSSENKQNKIKKLAEKRKTDDQSNLTRIYKQVGDFHGGIYDEWGFVSPWSKSACNYDSELMIIGQDWISEDRISKMTEIFSSGFDPSLPTNKNLQKLLKENFELDFTDVYATNLFVFVKPGENDSRIPMKDLIYSGKNYTLAEIEIISPKIVICLGSTTYNALCSAIGTVPSPFKDSLANPIKYGSSIIFGVPHTGARGTINAGGKDNVQKIWSDLATIFFDLKLKSEHLDKQGNEMSKNKKPQVNSDIPEVVPTSQAEQNKDGTTVYKPFKPLAYSLLCWIKSKGFKDQINLSDDGNSATYSFTMDSHDPSLKYHCFFELDETRLIRYYIYDFEDHFDTDDLDIYRFLADVNLRLPIGQFQLVSSDDGTVLRYYSSIDVTGIASDDPNYEGPFQIHPLLYERLFVVGADCMNRYIEAFRTGDIDTVGIKVPE